MLGRGGGLRFWCRGSSGSLVSGLSVYKQCIGEMKGWVPEKCFRDIFLDDNATAATDRSDRAATKTRR